MDNAERERKIAAARAVVPVGSTLTVYVNRKADCQNRPMLVVFRGSEDITSLVADALSFNLNDGGINIASHVQGPGFKIIRSNVERAHVLVSTLSMVLYGMESQSGGIGVRFGGES